METKDHYNTFGVERNATDEGIERVYRKLARKYRLGVAWNSQPESKFKGVHGAHDALKGLEKRAEYDNPKLLGRRTFFSQTMAWCHVGHSSWCYPWLHRRFVVPFSKREDGPEFSLAFLESR